MQKFAADKGYVQNLWLYGPDHHVTEVRLGLVSELRTSDSFFAFPPGRNDERVRCLQAERWQYVNPAHLPGFPNSDLLAFSQLSSS